MPRNKVLRSYTIREEQKPNGEISIRRTNRGFNCYEVMGLVSCAALEVYQQITGRMLSPKIIRESTPSDKVKRK